MSSIDTIKSSILKLENHMRAGSYRGYDPYDGLTSPLFGLPYFQTITWIRFVSQQIVKRSPVNIRPALAIKAGYNPVTLGLALHAISNLLTVLPERKAELQGEGDRLVSEIERVSSKGFSGYCWGYDFPWQARYASFPAHYPTVVATGIVTNGLFSYYETFGSARAFDMCRSAAKFVLNDLQRTYDRNTFCFSYSPNDSQIVFNATLKGARLLSQVFSVTKELPLAEEAGKTVRYVVNNQRPDGSWAYSSGDARTWVDNFHTGYVLDCLDEYIQRTGNREFRPALEKGLEFYVKNLFQDGVIPKYYSHRLYPIDSSAAAQSILTLARFGKLEQAENVALWYIRNMQSTEGYFFYRKGRFLTNRISYMRWSNAWMYAALAYLLSKLKNTAQAGAHAHG